MQFLRNRFPGRQALANAFYACVFVIQAWAIIQALEEVPALQHKETVWGAIGVLAIVQSVALFESVTVLLPLLALSAVLPPRFFRDRFAALSAGLVLLGALWATFAHYSEPGWAQWGNRKLLIWLGSYSLCALGAWALIQRSTRVERAINRALQGVALLAQVYLGIELIGVGITLLRSL